MPLILKLWYTSRSSMSLLCSLSVFFQLLFNFISLIDSFNAANSFEFIAWLPIAQLFIHPYLLTNCSQYINFLVENYLKYLITQTALPAIKGIMRLSSILSALSLSLLPLQPLQQATQRMLLSGLQTPMRQKPCYKSCNCPFQHLCV